MTQRMVSGRQRTDSTGTEGVLQLLDQLGDEWGAAPPVEPPARSREWPPISMQRKEDEDLLLGFRDGLARLAYARRQGPSAGEQAVLAALDGAQLVARDKILAGRREELRRLLPAFAYLVVLPIGGEAEAGRISGRAKQLIASA